MVVVQQASRLGQGLAVRGRWVWLALWMAFTLPTPYAADKIQEKVVVYNWSNYIPEGVLEDFTRETGIEVEYTTYDNNEIMYTRLKLLRGRGYDVVVPSTSLVAKMRDEGLLHPLDHALLPNLAALDPELLNKPYDVGNQYSVPYVWGSTGIGLNTAKIDPATVTKWTDLWQKKWRGQLLMADDMHEAFNIALRINGHKINSTDPDEIKQAYELLKKLLPNLKTISVEQSAAFLSGNVDIGIIWNGEAITAQAENPAIRYIYPAEGANFWIDSFAIPAHAIHVENAHTFINYMLREDVAVRCVQELGYATPHLAAKKSLDEPTRNNPAIFPPPEIMASADFYQQAGDASELYQLYWEKLKAGD